MNEHDKLQVNNFLYSISLWESAYPDAALSYVAIKKSNVLNLLYARIFLTPTLSSKTPNPNFETNNVRAGFCLVSEMGISLKDLIKEILENKRIKLPVGELIIPLNEGESVSAYFDPLHVDGINSGKRLSYLRLTGTNYHSLLMQPNIDWELKAATTPFDSLLDLTVEYSLKGCEVMNGANIEFIAQNVVEINLASKVEQDSAEPSLVLAKSLDPKKCTIGYRIFSDGKIYSRGSLSSDTLIWSQNENNHTGIGKLQVPIGAVIHCVATYEGYAHHEYWLSDSKNFPNSRRAILEESDNEFRVLKDYLFNEQKPRKTSRDFEFGVALLMWMLGFATSQPGATSRTTDSVDIIATTSRGNTLLIECTTGLLKADSKLATLIARTEAIKRRMQVSHRNLLIIPMIVSAMSREEVRTDLKDAQEHGIVVITREQLVQMLNQTAAITDSDIYFDQLISTIQTPTTF